ncbi:MAG: pilus motility taxis protein HmpF [Thermostichus sp. DG02_5_bins_236]
MLYLAELSKPIGFAKSSLQLLAKQQQDNTWVAVNEEAITLEGRIAQDANRFKDGSLVLAEISGSRQVSRISEAARQLVTYLQNFSRVQDKARSQEEEIEVWKQSLTFQAQELTRREMELEGQEEEVQRLYEQYRGVEEDRKLLDNLKQELETQQAYLAEQQRLIGQQREALNQQRQELEAQLQEAGSSRLGEEEAAQLQALIQQLQERLQPHQEALTPLHSLKSHIQQRQEHLNQLIAALEQERQQAQTQQNELDQDYRTWQERRTAWWGSRQSWDQTQAGWQAQQGSLRAYQEQLQQIAKQLQLQEILHQQAYRLIEEHDFITASGVSNGAAGAAAPPISLEELTTLVSQLRRDYEQRSAQVNQQRAELEQNRQALRELQERLAMASPDEQFDIEMDIDYAQSACGALEEALLPQEKNLQREYEELSRQEARLSQLQGQPAAAPSLPTVDIGPILGQIDSQKQALLQEQSRLQTLIQQLESSLQPQQENLVRQRQDLEQQWRQLEEEEGSLRVRTQVMAETWGRLNHLQATLYPERDLWVDLAAQLTQLETDLGQHQQETSTARAHVEQVQSLLATLAQA